MRHPVHGIGKQGMLRLFENKWTEQSSSVWSGPCCWKKIFRKRNYSQQDKDWTPTPLKKYYITIGQPLISKKIKIERRRKKII